MLRMLHRLTRLSSVSALLLCPTLVFAQSVTPRIRGPIETSPSIPLEGSLNPHVRVSEDLGPLAPDTPIRGITLVFKRSAAQEADLQQLLTQQTDPGSPLYHQWLTPDDFASRFGIADSDIAATESWLQSRGFTLDNVTPIRDRITFSGTAAQIHQAFGAELHRLRFDNETHFAPSTELSLPPTLAPLTAAVLHLSDFRPKPSIRPQPQYTTASNQTHFLSPLDMKGMYDGYDFFSLPTYGNYNQGLVIVGQSFVKTGTGSSIQNFQTGLAGGLTTITPVIVPGSGVEAIQPGDVGESEIDLEYSSSLLREANLFFVYTGVNPNYDVFDSVVFAITNDVAPVISISYGACEPLLSATNLQQLNAIFEQAAAQGQTIIASSGDSGASGCARYSSSQGVSTAQQQALAVDFPASSPYVTAVGGTQMAPGTFAAGTSTYWASYPSTDDVNSLIGYVPEVAWNEDSPTYGILASGGGASSVFPRPSWQSGVPGIPAGAYRLIPDIALQASVSSPGYIVCTDDPYIVGGLTDCTNGSLKASNGAYVITGGTSFGAPIFAALIADLNQNEHSAGLGNINPVLYSLAAQPPVYASAFHDITTGTTACTVGDGNCGTPGTTGYAATAGYDMATGLGSLDLSKFETAWPVVPTNGAYPTWLQISNAPQTANAGASTAVTVEVDISCPSGYCTVPPPSGSLSISVDGGPPTLASLVAPSTPQPLTASATYNFVAPSAAGSHVVVVRFPGDAYHLASTSTFSVLVGNVVPSGSFTLTANNLTLASNGSGSTQVTITPSAGYSGTLTWSSTASGGTVSQALCYLVQSSAVNGPSTATMYLGAGTSCNSSITGSRAPSPVQRTSLQLPAKPNSHHAPEAATFFALILCGLFPSRRTRKFLPLLSTTFLAILALTITGCGGVSSSGTGGGGGTTGPQPQVYTITLNATDSVNTSITASTTFTLTVNN